MLCLYRHVPSIIVKKKGKLPKHQLKHEFNFFLYKVCKIHLHMCIKIILCKKEKQFYGLQSSEIFAY